MPIAPFTAPERDVASKLGRAKAATNYYVLPGVALDNSTVTAAGLNLNADQYFFHYTPTPLVVDQLAAEITTLHAANNFRMGVYRATPNYQPWGAPLCDSGDISTATTGIKTYTPATPFLIPRGPFLTVMTCTSTTAAFRQVKGVVLNSPIDSAIATTPYVRFPRVTRSYAAFPTPGTAWDTVDASANTQTYLVFLRVSAP